eukprot:13401843-Alexandrium_andersonii.AAC.1
MRRAWNLTIMPEPAKHDSVRQSPASGQGLLACLSAPWASLQAGPRALPRIEICMSTHPPVRPTGSHSGAPSRWLPCRRRRIRAASPPSR